MDIVFITSARDSDRVTKIVNGFRWIASSPHAVDGENPWVIPSTDMMLEDKFMEFSFGHYSVCHIETGVLPFCRSVNIQFFECPVVELSANFKLERAEGVSDTFKTITDGMGVVVKGVDAPLVSHMGMVMESDSVNNWISHCGVWVLGVDPCPQRVGTFFIQSHAHLVEQSEVVLNRSVSILRGESFSSLFPHFLCRLGADEGIALFDELNCKLVELFEVIGGVGHLPRFVAHPLDVFFNVFNELLVFFGGVGIVKSQIALSVIDFGLHEVESHRLAMAYVEVSVGFGREPGQNDISELVDSVLQKFFGVQGRFHFSAN